jgi:hypothetical protein
VLDHDGRGPLELPHEPEHRLEIEVVVEGERLAVELTGGAEPDRLREGTPVERGLLMGVLAVAQLADALVGLKEDGRE